MRPALTLHLFGGVNLWHNGVALTTPKSRKGLALFIYLACTGRAHTREGLADLLWDATSTSQSLSNLRTILSRLPAPLAAQLLIDRATIALDPAGSLLIDAVELERVVKSTTAALNAQSAAQLATALASYQGEFLDGFTVEDATRFTEWLVVERERLRYLALDGYQRLTAYYLERGDYVAGIEVATALLRLDPTDEIGHAHLIQMLAYSGQRAAALAQFDAYRRMVQAEFGVEPDGALQELYTQIRDNAFAAPPTVTVAEAPAPRHNLPAQVTSLLGRQAEIAAVQALLQRVDVRLVTLTGPGGVGKSRLGEAVAWSLLPDFADGVFLIELAAIRDPHLVLSALAQTLAVRDQGSTPLQARLHDYLQEKQCLLLIDNFEQVIDAAPRLLELLRACPGVKILVTSRETLRLRGEHEFPVPTLAPADAVTLFTQRAQALQPTFRLEANMTEVVASICQQLDYLPLALELAVAQSKLFAPPAILARLQDRFAFLIGRTRDLPDRQRTLRATLDWSYDLLTEEEKQLFRRLAVFRGGRSLEAVETICNPNDDEQIAPLAIDALDGLTALLEKSFLYQTTDSTGEPRFMLLVTIHEYAMDRLTGSGEAEALRQRHLDYYMALAEGAELELAGAHQIRWLDRLETELDNVRAALHYSLLMGEIERGARLSGALWRFWGIRGYISEGREWLTALLAQEHDTTPLIKAKVFNAAGNLASRQSDYTQAISFHQEALTIRRVQGDKAGIALSLMNLGGLARDQGDYDTARNLLEESLALNREVDNKVNLALSLTNLSSLAYALDEYALSRVYAEESLALNRTLNNRWGIALSLEHLASLMGTAGDYPAARLYYEEVLAIRQELGDKSAIAWILQSLGWINQRLGHYDITQRLYAESLTLKRELGDKAGTAGVLSDQANIHHNLGDSHTAQALLQQSLAIYQSIGNKAGIAVSLNGLGWVSRGLGNDDAAQALLEESLSLHQALGSKDGIATALHNLANLARKQGNSPLARSRYRESLLLIRELGNQGWYELALRDIALLFAQEAKPAVAAQLSGATEAYRATTGVTIPPREVAAYEQTLAAARTGLGEAAFATAWAAGRAMTLDQAVDDALAELEARAGSVVGSSLS
ncbi:MAG: tetratricopeptide repeat protein [Caldilineaceae bacterium]